MSPAPARAGRIAGRWPWWPPSPPPRRCRRARQAGEPPSASRAGSLRRPWASGGALWGRRNGASVSISRRDSGIRGTSSRSGPPRRRSHTQPVMPIRQPSARYGLEVGGAAGEAMHHHARRSMLAASRRHPATVSPASRSWTNTGRSRSAARVSCSQEQPLLVGAGREIAMKIEPCLADGHHAGPAPPGRRFPVATPAAPRRHGGGGCRPSPKGSRAVHRPARSAAAWLLARSVPVTIMCSIPAARARATTASRSGSNWP